MTICVVNTLEIVTASVVNTVKNSDFKCGQYYRIVTICVVNTLEIVTVDVVSTIEL